MKKNRTTAAKTQKAMKKHVKNKARKTRAEAQYDFHNTVAKVKSMQEYFNNLNKNKETLKAGIDE